VEGLCLNQNPSEAAAGRYRADVPDSANQFGLGRTVKDRERG
jgi:hypothetical protein